LISLKSGLANNLIHPMSCIIESSSSSDEEFGRGGLEALLRGRARQSPREILRAPGSEIKRPTRGSVPHADIPALIPEDA